MRSSGIPAIILAASASAVAALVVAACSGSGGNSSAVPAPHPSPTTAIGPNLYVANFDFSSPNPQVFNQFDPPFSVDSAPAITIDDPSVVSVASDSTVVAATGDSTAVTIYAQPLSASSTPAAVITDVSPETEKAEFDSSGNLWVSNTDGEPNSVAEFAAPIANAETPALTVSTDVVDPIGLAFDANNNLYVVDAEDAPPGNENPSLLVFAPPYNAAPTILQLSSFGEEIAIGVAIDGSELAVGIEEEATEGIHPHGLHSHPESIVRRHRLLWPHIAHRGAFPQQIGSAGEVEIYTLPITSDSTPTAVIQMDEADDLAFDSAGNLYVGNDEDNDVDVFAPPFSNSSTAAYSIDTGIDEPAGVNFGP
jgi:hypothetical protein